MKAVFFFLIIVCLQAEAQDLRKDKDVLLLGGVELAFPVYENVTGSVCGTAAITKIYLSGFTGSLKFGFSPNTDFGMLKSLFVGIGYNSPFKYSLSAFIEAGGEYTWVGGKSDKGYRYTSDGPYVAVGMNYRPDETGRFLITTSLTGITYNLFYLNTRKGSFSAIASLGLMYTFF